MAQTQQRILVIDDERGIRSLCGDVLRRAGYETEVAETGMAGLAAAAAKPVDLVFCDINLPDIDGLQVLTQMQERDITPTVILITAYPSVETAVRGMKLGARDYLTKPFTPDELRMVAQRALSEDALRRENQDLREELAYGNLVGDSEPMQELRRTIAVVSRSDANVLVTGESGTGKELVARALHYQGNRSTKAFVPVNCGALVDNLLESELFGHVRGAFTGADQAKRGLFVTANDGTLFLDEVGELPLQLQPKLLRVLQDGEIKPVGGVDSTRVDARLIAATNRDLAKAVQDGTFRQDLFYRLNVIAIEVPALRNRRDDIALLAEHFAERAAIRARRGRVNLDETALTWLKNQPWPGNVRELENALERAVVLAAGETLTVADFQPRGMSAQVGSPSHSPSQLTAASPDEMTSLDEVERVHILRVLAGCNGQKTKASAILGINRTTLWKKLRQYGIE